ncbi:hypothetical protein ACAF76_009515 [Brevibacillus sp. TJ4]|uniref:hypothetical protein n=1 Tax=Brevibacillus sp. TJ4 TaxID=3234853 RepID=UPI003BA38C9A
MANIFEAFTSALNWQQVSLLLDTVTYFEDAPKLLSIPAEQGETVAVPLIADTLRSMLSELDEQDAFARRPFHLSWEAGQDEQTGTLVVGLPSGATVRQATDLTQFSAV